MIYCLRNFSECELSKTIFVQMIGDLTVKRNFHLFSKTDNFPKRLEIIYSFFIYFIIWRNILISAVKVVSKTVNVQHYASDVGLTNYNVIPRNSFCCDTKFSKLHLLQATLGQFYPQFHSVNASDTDITSDSNLSLSSFHERKYGKHLSHQISSQVLQINIEKWEVPKSAGNMAALVQVMTHGRP